MNDFLPHTSPEKEIDGDDDLPMPNSIILGIFFAIVMIFVSAITLAVAFTTNNEIGDAAIKFVAIGHIIGLLFLTVKLRWRIILGIVITYITPFLILGACLTISPLEIH